MILDIYLMLAGALANITLQTNNITLITMNYIFENKHCHIDNPNGQPGEVKKKKSPT